MKHALQIVIVLEWLLAGIGALWFLILYGAPWRYEDRTMAWHLAAMAAATLIEVVGLFLAGWSLWPSAVAYALVAGLIYWRLWLLLRARRR